MRILPYDNNLRLHLISIWEQSVRATHQFLSAEDFDFYQQIVAQIDFGQFQIFFCAEDSIPLGFIGMDNRKIEMLFLLPESIGKGYGKFLLNFALTELYATEVDVNEQNENAVTFYEHFGFVTYDRSELDPSGKPYPILHMRLGS